MNDGFESTQSVLERRLLEKKAEFAEDKIDTSGRRTEIPLDLLENGEVQLFAEFVAWYLCDESEITLKVV
ncbi:hypothetical protein [Aliivibrio fischeri]|uniref:Uncharacterized protein n=1 Tax=Aliivibrio fischeri TaxID=668 RepID=A0A844P039_ALIFS|nr:hypothetical protein [Aliivibrio fischeri]MUK48768.1 hypothetical protein [Aliivibrio fischeri]